MLRIGFSMVTVAAGLHLVLGCSTTSGDSAGPDSGTPADGATTDASDGAAPADAGSPDSTSRFLGVWKVTSGTASTDCPGSPALPPDQDDKGGIVRIKAGAQPGQIVAVQDGSGCSVVLAVTGNIAKAIGHDECKSPYHRDCSMTTGSSFDGGIDGGHRSENGMSPDFVSVIQLDELTLADDGQTYRETFTQDLNSYLTFCDGPTAVTFDCKVTGNDLLQKQP